MNKPSPRGKTFFFNLYRKQMLRLCNRCILYIGCCIRVLTKNEIVLALLALEFLDWCL